MTPKVTENDSGQSGVHKAYIEDVCEGDKGEADFRARDGIRGEEGGRVGNHLYTRNAKPFWHGAMRATLGRLCKKNIHNIKIELSILRTFKLCSS